MAAKKTPAKKMPAKKVAAKKAMSDSDGRAPARRLGKGRLNFLLGLRVKR